MGAKCCTSEAAAGARRERALEAYTDGGVEVETRETLQGEEKPLWLQEVEEARVVAKAAPPLPPPSDEPPAAEAAPATAATSAKARPASRAANPEGKARARKARREPDPLAEGAAVAPDAGVGEKPSQRAEAKGRRYSAPPAQAAPPAGPAPAPAPALAPAPTPARAAAAPAPVLGTERRSAGGNVSYVLKISILGARGLRNADTTGASDPYCTCEIVGKSSSKFRTETINDTLEPYWYHQTEVTGFSYNDSLAFNVYDKDVLTADDSLGKAVLRASDIIPSGFKGELDLFEKLDGKGPEAGKLEVFVKVGASCLGGSAKPTVRQIKASEREAGAHLPVRVTIFGASKLRNTDWAPGAGVSDPYCIFGMAGVRKSEVRTPVAQNTLNPKWDFTATINDYIEGEPIVFTVMDKDRFKRDDFLGRVTLDGDELFGGSYYGELNLCHGGSIKVRIEPVEKPAKEDKAPEASNPSSGASAAEAEAAAADGGAASSAAAVPAPKAPGASEAPEALLQAAERGDVKEVRRLLAAGVALDSTNSQGQSSLHIAVLHRHGELVARLMQRKGKKRLLGLRTVEKDTALHLAARDDLKDICLTLVKEGANARIKNGQGKLPHELAKGELAAWLQGEDPASTPPPWLK